MINYYQIIIVILIGLIIYNISKNKLFTNTKIIEPSIEQKTINLSVLEKKNKEKLENMSHKNQRFFFSPGNKLTKLQILTNFYTQQFMPF